MPAPADKQSRGADLDPDGRIAQLTTQLNNVVASMRLLTAKLDADAGVTDTDYDATITASGVATAPCKVTTVG